MATLSTSKGMAWSDLAQQELLMKLNKYLLNIGKLKQNKIKEKTCLIVKLKFKKELSNWTALFIKI